jgi:hypothetical protein
MRLTNLRAVDAGGDPMSQKQTRLSEAKALQILFETLQETGLCSLETINVDGTAHISNVYFAYRLDSSSASYLTPGLAALPERRVQAFYGCLGFRLDTALGRRRPECPPLWEMRFDEVSVSRRAERRYANRFEGILKVA